MSQFNKAAIIALLTTPMEAKKAEADSAAEAFIADKRERALAAKPLIDTLNAQFEQIIRELRKGTTKETRRRILDAYKDGSAKKQADDIIALVGPTALPTAVAKLRTEVSVLEGVISVLNAVEGDTLDLQDLIRTGAFRLLPTQDPEA